MSPGEPPTVRFTLGEGVEALLAESSYPFPRLVELHAIDLVAVTEVVRCVHARAPGGFDLPEAALVALRFVAGKLTSARICPHVGPLSDAEAARVSEQVAALVGRAGWRRVPGLGTAAGAISAELADPDTPIDALILVGKWIYGDDEVLIEVERSGSAEVPGEPTPAPTSLVRVRIENAPLVERAIAEVADTGSEIIWRRRAEEDAP
ncbi:hypothetical protein [Sorangium sp. So ce426]|uniref:hypothetical protein n=1 Tax=unclassified Sorangium TaxID=2621164 RepID=UPI003F5BFCA9